MKDLANFPRCITASKHFDEGKNRFTLLCTTYGNSSHDDCKHKKVSTEGNFFKTFFFNMILINYYYLSISTIRGKYTAFLCHLTNSQSLHKMSEIDSGDKYFWLGKSRLYTALGIIYPKMLNIISNIQRLKPLS